MEQKELSPLTLKEQIQSERAKRSLYEFVKQAWPIIEPSTPFVDGWHIQAVCRHLEACTRGEIKSLLINIPPRHMKSIITSVMWPTWVWTFMPEKRFLCSSYALSLAVRDSRKSKIIIESDWYQRRWRNVYQISQDQSAKMRYENDKKGYRLAVSTESAATGEGGDIVLCISGETSICTELGNISIANIVNNNVDTRIMSYNHEFELFEWKEIEAYEKNLGRQLYRVTFSDGRFIDMTGDHPVYVVGKGYIQASQLNVNDKVITNDSVLQELQQGTRLSSFENKQGKKYLLRKNMQGYVQQRRKRQRLSRRSVRNCKLRYMWERSSQKAERYQESEERVLQPEMQGVVSDWRGISGISRRENNRTLRSMRQRSNAQRGSSFEKYKSHFLQSYMPRNMADGREQSCLSRWKSRKNLYGLRESILCQTRGSKEAWGKVLLRYVQEYREQTCLHSWDGLSSLHGGFSQARKNYTEKRQLYLPTLQNFLEERSERFSGASYRFRQDKQCSRKSHHSLCKLSRKNAWQYREQNILEGVLVKSVEPIGKPEFVYNLRIKDNHNYFAGANSNDGGGILLHNCDDPHNVRDSYSQIKREATLLWWSTTMSTRLNSPRHGVKIIIMQRVHDDDLSGYVLEQGGYTHLCLPAEFEPDRKCFTSIGWEDPRHEEGELLWPEQMGRTELDKMKVSLGAFGYAAQFQQRPVPPGGAIFKQEYLRYFTVDERFFLLFVSGREGMKRVLRDQCWMFATIDLAASQKSTADYTVISTWAVTPENELLLVEQIRDRMTGPQIQEQIASCYYRFGHRFLSIETVGFQLVMVQQLLRAGIPVQEFRPGKDKVSRAISASVFYAGGMIYHLQGAAYLHAFEPELLNFPKARHDDCVDCVSMATEIAFLPNQPNIRYLDDEEDFESAVISQMERGTDDWGDI